jgi:hypothetical protein
LVYPNIGDVHARMPIAVPWNDPGRNADPRSSSPAKRRLDRDESAGLVLTPKPYRPRPNFKHSREILQAAL